MSTAPITVLHVDDDASVAELTRELLQRETDQIGVVTETDPSAGIDRLVGTVRSKASAGRSEIARRGGSVQA